MSKQQAQGTVVAVCRNPEPGLPKHVVDEIHLLANYGIEGDYHAGHFVRHRYLARKNPTAPNLRQVLLIDTSIFTDLNHLDIQLEPGMMAENITLEGIVVKTLSVGTQIKVGTALLEVTEVRDPCKQLNVIDSRLLKSLIIKQNGIKHSNAGIMARILQEGRVRAGDKVTLIEVEKAVHSGQ